MRYVTANGVNLSAIGLGTWQFGSREWGYGTDYAQKGAVEILHRALDLGVNVVDTAEVYAFGRSERIVGRAIRERRDEVFVATKIFPVLPVAPVVRQRAEASRRRLGVDRLDLYQVHWRNPVIPVASTMHGMRSLLEDGSVAHAGVSNFSLDGWQGAETHLGLPVLSNQVQFSLAHPRPRVHLVPWAAEHDRIVIAYSPLGQGLLSGRYGPDNPPPGVVRSGNALFLPENLERAAKLLDTLREVASGHDATPSQIALAWLIHHPNVVVIPGASSVAQLEANVAAADVVLAPGEVDALTDAAESFDPITGLDATMRIVRRRIPIRL
ncbi:MAG: aldo/keto reductase [Acidimicrobiia bacterium]|nr:aldo/keto reductase [Acidimicrobiia bacterium]